MVLTNISFQLQSKFLYASAADEGSCYYFSHFIKLYKIQRVISCSTRLIFKAPKSAHITLLLYDLHWLPISSRIQYIPFHNYCLFAQPLMERLFQHVGLFLCLYGIPLYYFLLLFYLVSFHISDIRLIL